MEKKIKNSSGYIAENIKYPRKSTQKQKQKRFKANQIEINLKKEFDPYTKEEIVKEVKKFIYQKENKKIKSVKEFISKGPKRQQYFNERTFRGWVRSYKEKYVFSDKDRKTPRIFTEQLLQELDKVLIEESSKSVDERKRFGKKEAKDQVIKFLTSKGIKITSYTDKIMPKILKK